MGILLASFLCRTSVTLMEVKARGRSLFCLMRKGRIRAWVGARRNLAEGRFSDRYYTANVEIAVEEQMRTHTSSRGCAIWASRTDHQPSRALSPIPIASPKVQPDTTSGTTSCVGSHTTCSISMSTSTSSLMVCAGISELRWTRGSPNKRI